MLDGGRQTKVADCSIDFDWAAFDCNVVILRSIGQGYWQASKNICKHKKDILDDDGLLGYDEFMKMEDFRADMSDEEKQKYFRAEDEAFERRRATEERCDYFRVSNSSEDVVAILDKYGALKTVDYDMDFCL